MENQRPAPVRALAYTRLLTVSLIQAVVLISAFANFVFAVVPQLASGPGWHWSEWWPLGLLICALVMVVIVPGRLLLRATLLTLLVVGGFGVRVLWLGDPQAPRYFGRLPADGFRSGSPSVAPTLATSDPDRSPFIRSL